MASLLKLSGLIVTLVFITRPVAAHHSGAIYDHERSVNLHGTVTRLRWANPHVYIELETKNDTGESVQWLIEGLSPSGMSHGGWSRQSLVPGEQVIVTGSPSRNPDRNMALGHTVTKEDGTLLEIPSLRSRLGPPPMDLPTPIVANSLSGRWATRWNPGVASGFLRARMLWSLTDKGIAAMDNYEVSMDPAIDCVPEPIPYVMIFPSGKSLEITETVTMIRNELGGDRNVHMNIDSHDGANFTDQGHSIGWWEGEVLVVDTTHFADHRRGLAFGGLASGPQKHLIEHFELSPDKTTMQYTYWLEDPEYLAEPTTGKLVLVYRPDRPFVNEPCDLESARRYLDE
jgi:hypothetical protein